MIVSPKVTPEKSREYVENDGAECPYCGSKNISYTSDYDMPWAHVECEGCASSWDELWELQGVGDVSGRDDMKDFSRLAEKLTGADGTTILEILRVVLDSHANRIWLGEQMDLSDETMENISMSVAKVMGLLDVADIDDDKGPDDYDPGYDFNDEALQD